MNTTTSLRHTKAARVHGDVERAAFLRALDEAPVEVTDWEAGFIEGNLNREIFSESQRGKIDQLRRKYRNDI